jgi:hypothetical protein
MTTQNMNIALIEELHHQVKVALGKINASRKLQILTWDGNGVDLHRKLTHLAA